MTAPDPYGWGDYPSLADLQYDMCALAPKCQHGHEMPLSPHCYWHATDAERVAIDAHYSTGPTPADEREAAVDAADDAGVDADWGTE